MDLVGSFQRVLATEGYIESLGWVLAFGLIIGFAFDGKLQNLIRWVIAVLLFAVCLQAVTYHYLLVQGRPSDAGGSIAILITVLLVYLPGIAGGWYLSTLARKRGREAHTFEEKI